MKTRAASISVVLVAAGIAAGTQGSSHEQLVKQLLGSFEKINAALESIKDEDSAGAAKPDLRKAAESFLDARAKADKLPPPEKDEKDRLEKNYKPKLNVAMQKMATQIRRVELIPGGKDAP